MQAISVPVVLAGKCFHAKGSKPCGTSMGEFYKVFSQ